MITFDEGLPRSGKSHSVMKDEIVPALAKGREVWAYIEGLNHEAIAPLAGISVERCRELLHQVTREQVPDIADIVTNDSLVVIDEIQNFWPKGRKSLSERDMQFVTEHGHRGLDIVLMGQCIDDIHDVWKRRVEVKRYYLKKSATGKPDSYQVTIFRAVLSGNRVKFEPVTKESHDYDKKIFGTYKSHTDGTENKATKVDPRSVIWNHPFFKRWGRIALVVLAGCAWYVWHLFHGGLQESIVKKNPMAQASGPISTETKTVPAPTPMTAKDRFPDPLEPPDVIEDLTTKNKIRLLGWWRVGQKTDGLIEWRDAGNTLVHKMTFTDLGGLGWTVMVNQSATIATLVKGPAHFVATAWPIDRAEGRTSETTQQIVSGRGPGAVVPPVADQVRGVSAGAGPAT